MIRFIPPSESILREVTLLHAKSLAPSTPLLNTSVPRGKKEDERLAHRTVSHPTALTPTRFKEPPNPPTPLPPLHPQLSIDNTTIQINRLQDLPRTPLDESLRNEPTKPIRVVYTAHAHLLRREHASPAVQTYDRSPHPHNALLLLPVAVDELSLNANRDRTPAFQRPHERALRGAAQRRAGVAERREEGRGGRVCVAYFDAECALAYGVEESWRGNSSGDAGAEVEAEEACGGEDEASVGGIWGVEFRQTG